MKGETSCGWAFYVVAVTGRVKNMHNTTGIAHILYRDPRPKLKIESLIEIYHFDLSQILLSFLFYKYGNHASTFVLHWAHLRLSSCLLILSIHLFEISTSAAGYC